MKRTILGTGGTGFIGSAVCRRLIAKGQRIINVNKLTYSGNLASLSSIDGHPDYRFYLYDICDAEGIARILASEDVDAAMHLAAESHVDRSIDGPESFVKTNVFGTVRAAGGRARLLARADGGAGARFSVPPCVDRRSFRRPPVRQ